jgi:microcompartment protein CcmK/EutM
VQLGRVVGTLVSTRKDPKLQGLKFLVVQHLDVEMGVPGGYAIAVDTVGAGLGDVVLHVAGSSARMTEQTQDRPVDACIMAIVDSIHVGDRRTYDKAAPEAS